MSQVKRVMRRFYAHRKKHGFWVMLLTKLGVPPLYKDELGCQRCRYCGERFSPEDEGTMKRNWRKFIKKPTLILTKRG